MPRLFKGPHQRIASGSRWIKIRAQVLAEEPLCRLCEAEGKTTPATQVDHILALHLGGTNDRENLQGICEPHHVDKTVRERGDVRTAAFDEKGNPLGGTHWN